jgi:hypothetical protein
MILVNRYWRWLALLMRLDITASITITAGLPLWLNWH